MLSEKVDRNYRYKIKLKIKDRIIDSETKNQLINDFIESLLYHHFRYAGIPIMANAQNLETLNILIIIFLDLILSFFFSETDSHMLNSKIKNGIFEVY